MHGRIVVPPNKELMNRRNLLFDELDKFNKANVIDMQIPNNVK